MESNASGHHTLWRTFRIFATIALVTGMLVALAPSSRAKENTCRARNVTQGTARSSDLQAVINAADPGDLIVVKFVCVGNFRIDRRLTLVGRPSPRVPRPVLYASGVGRVLVVDAQATFKNLKITRGDAADWGGGIWNTATLVLEDTLVSHNTAIGGGGIWNQGVLTLNGSSSVSENTVACCGHGGGIINGYHYGSTVTLTLNDSSSVTGNSGGGIFGGYTFITLNDSSSVSGNNNGSGIVNRFGAVTLNGSSSVSGNQSFSGGGIYAHNGTLTLNDSSSVSGNFADFSGGGIYATRHVAVTLNDSSSVTANTADADDRNDGTGGGIFRTCKSFLTGAVDGGNVNDNYLGSAAPVENNIVIGPC